MGQSAGTTAVPALDKGVAVQDVDYDVLKKRLRADGQIINAKTVSPGRGGIDPKKLDGIVVDNLHAKVQGNWGFSTSSDKWVGGHYLHDGNKGDATALARYEIQVPKAGRYEVRVACSQHANRATNVPVAIQHAGGESVVVLNQKIAPRIDTRFSSLGVFEFTRAAAAVVTISNEGTHGYVIADAVQLIARSGTPGGGS